MDQGQVAVERARVSLDTKLETLTLSERVYDYLRSEILSNRLAPGSVLNEVALATSLGVSRGPLREAIRQLAAEGLVTARPRRSAVVNALSPGEFLEAYQVRESLETLAVRLAVTRIEESEIARLQQLTQDMQQAAERQELPTFFEANARFHLLLVECSGNQKLTDVYRKLAAQMGRYRMPSLALRGSLHRSIAEHRAIVHAISSRKVERATRLISEHIRVPQRSLDSSGDTELVLMPTE